MLNLVNTVGQNLVKPVAVAFAKTKEAVTELQGKVNKGDFGPEGNKLNVYEKQSALDLVNTEIKKLSLASVINPKPIPQVNASTIKAKLEAIKDGKGDVEDLVQFITNGVDNDDGEFIGIVRTVATNIGKLDLNQSVELIGQLIKLPEDIYEEVTSRQDKLSGMTSNDMDSWNGDLAAPNYLALAKENPELKALLETK